MKRLGTSVIIAMLVGGIAFAANQTSTTDTTNYRGEIEKIDLKQKTITLLIKASPTEQATQTGSTATEPQTQTSPTPKGQTKVFKFTDSTTLSALEAEESPTTTKIQDLEKGDELIVHVDANGVIQKIEIVEGD